MLTRRQFLRILAATIGSVVASGCVPATPAPTSMPPATPLPISTAQPTGTPTQEPTVTPTVAPTATSTATATPTSTATASPTPTLTATQMPLEFVTIRGDQFYYRGAVFPIKGFNYYPKMHPWRTFNIGDWDPRGIERELVLGANLGANTIRIFVDYQFSLDNSKAQQTRDTYFAPVAHYVENVREFLGLADRLGMKAIVTLFDSLDWPTYQPANQWIAEEYVKALIPPFAGDPRILCWDLQNEPDRAIALAGNTAVISFFKRISSLVRQMDPEHLQTIGWIDRARAKYFPDLDPYLDFWCFHFYDKADRLNELVRFYKTKTKKPVLLEEYGLATGGPGASGNNSEQDQAAHYATVLSTLDNSKMCGSVFWTLVDFPQGLAGNPPSPDDSPENHFGVYRLDYTAKPAAVQLAKYWLPSPDGRLKPL